MAFCSANMCKGRGLCIRIHRSDMPYHLHSSVMCNISHLDGDNCNPEPGAVTCSLQVQRTSMASRLHYQPFAGMNYRGMHGPSKLRGLLGGGVNCKDPPLFNRELSQCHTGLAELGPNNGKGHGDDQQLGLYGTLLGSIGQGLHRTP